MSQNLDLREIQSAIQLGFDMEDFKNSNVGRYFAARAKEAMLDGMSKLRNADAFNAAAVSKAQQSILVPEQFFVWMSEAIDGGDSAKAAFEEVHKDPVDAA